MNNQFKYLILVLLATGILNSCSKMKGIGILNTGSFNDTSGTLKSVAGSVAIGFAAYQGDAGFAKYFPVIVKEGSVITPGNEMKHGSIVQNDGTMNFTKADALYSQANAAGIKVFGHTLMWHQQQNATYLKSIAGNGSAVLTSVLPNSGFEDRANDPYPDWNSYNGGITRSIDETAANVRTGKRSLKLNLPVKQSANYSAQCVSANVAVDAGTDYIVIAYVKGSDASGTIQLQLQTSSYGNVGGYSGNLAVGTSWTSLSKIFNTGSNTSVHLTFDCGLIASSTWIDDVIFMKKADYDAAQAAASGPATAARVDSLMKLWIVGTSTAPGIVTHYAGKVIAWDVANEVLAENGTIRTSSNTTVPSGRTDYFFWADYMGKNGIVNAFKYAHQADANAKLFINDYNLESSKAKTDSLVALVSYIKANGGQVDGIGTQMHCDALTTSYTGIDYMFQQLAATGLQIRISELDVTIKASATDATIADPLMLGYQAAMYQYIINSYFKNVPVAQRYGITFWGVDDPDSWRSSQLPVLWDKNFAKKPAYSAVSKALQGK